MEDDELSRNRKVKVDGSIEATDGRTTEDAARKVNAKNEDACNHDTARRSLSS